MRRRLEVPLAILLASMPPSGAASDPALAGGGPPAFRVYVRDDGVYRVTYEELLAAGLPEGPHPSRDLGLANRGEPVPLWLADGGDGSFGPGDAFEFVGSTLPGDEAYHHEYSPHNVYQLRWDGAIADRMRPVPPPGKATREAVPARELSRLLHLEEDRLLIRIQSFSSPVNQAEVRQPETWFWAKLTHIDPGPFEVPLDLPDLDASSRRPVSLRIHFRALSRPWKKPDGFADHQVTASVAGRALGSTTWDGKVGHLWELDGLDASMFAGPDPILALRVPARSPADGEEPLVDVVMLNWVEIRYPHRGVVGPRPVRLEVGDGAGDLGLHGDGVRSLVAYGPGGTRLAARPGTPVAGSARRFRLGPVSAGSSLFLVPDDRLRSVERIELDPPSHLRDGENRADYLILAHRSLLEASRPLAELHRRRGLEVALIDVQDVYDEFQHGIVHPRAIRSFIEHAYRRWRPPHPRFVLLVGDASWDSKNAGVDDTRYANWSDRQLLDGPQFVEKQSALYARSPQANDRGLIPTWNSWTSQGHAASDNFFVAVDGEDYLPDLAIGRLPVRDPDEVAAIIAKIAGYLEAPVGPWRRRILWITNEEPYSQRLSDDLSAAGERRGYVSQKVYPRPEETGNEEHQARLGRAFDDGELLVHFYGHGGRYIWRTGPPDFRKNHDLFTLDDLEKLAPSPRLPVVLSMTCFTAPFDHPNADSIGEKFLRLPGRGAIAVLGASWRNVPSPAFSAALVEQLTRPGTIGEAVRRAKVEARDRIMVETYNLLGDPALPVAVPAGTIRLTVSGEGPTVLASFDEELSGGRAVIDWLDREGGVLESSEASLSGTSLRTRFGGGPPKAGSVSAVRVYAWDESRRVDAIGWTELKPEEP